MAKSPSKTTDLQVVNQGSTDTVSVLTGVSVLNITAGQMAAEIQADIERYERTSREAAFIALRIGIRLIWIRDNEAYGSLKAFVAKHFQHRTERTLFRYITVAHQFLLESGLIDRTTHKLTGKALTQAAPIVTEQLELFTDPKAKLEGALKKVVKWVGQRGLADIYRELEAKKLGNKPPPGGKSAKNDFQGGSTNREELSLETLIAHAAEEFGLVTQIYEAKAWQNLSDEDLAAYESHLDKWRGEISQLLKDRQTAALRGGAAKGKGARL